MNMFTPPKFKGPFLTVNWLKHTYWLFINTYTPTYLNLTTTLLTIINKQQINSLLRLMP